MFNEKLLRELATLEGTGPVLTVYLNVDPTAHTAEEYKLILREMLKQAEDDAEAEDIEAVKRYVDYEYDWAGRGLAIFSRQADDIWHALTLSVPVRSGVTVARKPYISPLVELNSLYGRYAVAQVDRQGARFYLFQMGEAIAEEEFDGETLKGRRKEKGSSMAGMLGGGTGSKNKMDEVVRRNMREAAEALNRFAQRYHPRRIILAGSEQNVAQFQEALPNHLQNVVVGAFNADMEASEMELRDNSLQILQKVETLRKESLIEAVVTAAAKGANGIVRLDETLSAAHEGRIQVLVLERDYHSPGYRCTGCGYLTTQNLGTCPFCGADFAKIPDAAEAVVSQVVEKGGTVEVVEDEAMGETQIGALLRY